MKSAFGLIITGRRLVLTCIFHVLERTCVVRYCTICPLPLPSSPKTFSAHYNFVVIVAGQKGNQVVQVSKCNE